MKKFVMSLDTMFVVEAKNEKEAYEKAYQSIPPKHQVDFVIMEDVTDDEAFQDRIDEK